MLSTGSASLLRLHTQELDLASPCYRHLHSAVCHLLGALITLVF